MLENTLEKVSNRATYDEKITLLDAETKEPIDPTGLTLVWAMAPVAGAWGDYSWGDLWSNPTIVASSLGGTAGVINIIDAAAGVIQVLIPASAMRVCAPAVYAVGFTAKTDDTDICQIIVGQQSIIEGVVTSP